MCRPSLFCLVHSNPSGIWAPFPLSNAPPCWTIQFPWEPRFPDAPSLGPGVVTWPDLSQWEAFPGFRLQASWSPCRGRASRPSFLPLGKVHCAWAVAHFSWLENTADPSLTAGHFSGHRGTAVLGHLAPPWIWAANEWSFCLSYFVLGYSHLSSLHFTRRVLTCRQRTEYCHGKLWQRHLYDMPSYPEAS